MSTSFSPIPKPPIDKFEVTPNLNYDTDLDGFDWQTIMDELDWLPGG